MFCANVATKVKSVIILYQKYMSLGVLCMYVDSFMVKRKVHNLANFEAMPLHYNTFPINLSLFCRIHCVPCTND